MNGDWKDLLSSMRGKFQEAEPETNNIDDSKNKNSLVQSSPLKVVIDKKGRNGKVATIIEDFTIPKDEIDSIARELKTKLGVGGSTRDNEILIQGDHKAKVIEFLKNKNFKVH